MRLSRHEGVQPGPINLGNPLELTVSDLADRVIRLTGSNANLVHRPLPVDDPRRRRPDIGRAMKLLKWQPQVGLEEGLERTIAWFARAIERPRRKMNTEMPAVAAE